MITKGGREGGGGRKFEEGFVAAIFFFTQWGGSFFFFLSGGICKLLWVYSYCFVALYVLLLLSVLFRGGKKSKRVYLFIFIFLDVKQIY